MDFEQYLDLYSEDDTFLNYDDIEEQHFRFDLIEGKNLNKWFSDIIDGVEQGR